MNMVKYLARVEEIEDGFGNAILRPLYRVDSSSLEKLNEQIATRHFYPKGTIRWPEVPASVKQNEFWVFTTTDMVTSYSTEAFKEIKPLVEIINFIPYMNGQGDEGLSYILSTVMSISLTFQPSSSVYLQLGHDSYAGPVFLKEVREPEQRWKIGIAETGGYLSFSHILASAIIKVEEAPNRRFIFPEFRVVKSYKSIYIRGNSYSPTITRQSSAIATKPSASKETGSPQQTLTVANKNNQIAQKKQLASAPHISAVASVEVAAPNVSVKPDSASTKENVKPKNVVIQNVAIQKQPSNQQEPKTPLSAPVGGQANSVAILSQKNEIEIATRRGPDEKNPVTNIQAKLVNAQDIFPILKDAFAQQDLTTEVAIFLHATFQAGGFPVLVGERAQCAFDTYAHCVTDDRIMTVPVFPTLLEPAELFGWVDHNAKCFLPHAAGLADFILEAQQHEDDLYLVVFEGINRSAIENYLQPLLTLYYEGINGDCIHPFPLFHPDAVHSSDRYATLARMQWPRNVLLAGTLSDGVATIPPPPSFWNNATLLKFESIQPELSMEDKGQETLYSVRWQSWQEGCNRIKKQSALMPLASIYPEITTLSRDGDSFRKRLYQVLKELVKDYTKALDTFMVISTMPQELASDRTHDALKNVNENMRQAIAAIERLVQ
jgi:hypothetical protein